MKKIPTLFQREFDHHRVVNISPVVPPDLQWVLDGEGVATEKTDGACCAIINGVFYKRYDAKKDKRGKMKLPPEGAIPCDDPDPITGHWPHWVRVDENDPADRWFLDPFIGRRRKTAHSLMQPMRLWGRIFRVIPTSWQRTRSYSTGR